jgi:hypothetical protein
MRWVGVYFVGNFINEPLATFLTAPCQGPFNYLDMLPSPPEEIGTVFYLYTRRNKELPQVLAYNNITTVSQSHFNATSPTKVIIHGFGSSCDKIWAREMRLSFLLVVS